MAEVLHKGSANCKDYICKTCQSSFGKSCIPGQAVYSMLEIYSTPPELKELTLHYLKRLERGLLSERICFKKIGIMLKGLFPKLRGVICKIPTEIRYITGIIPQTADSNSLLSINLKGKLNVGGHVYFEATSPDSRWSTKFFDKFIRRVSYW